VNFDSRGGIVSSSHINTLIYARNITSVTFSGGSKKKTSNMVGNGGDEKNHKDGNVQKECVVLIPPKRKRYVNNEQELLAEENTKQLVDLNENHEAQYDVMELATVAITQTNTIGIIGKEVYHKVCMFSKMFKSPYTVLAMTSKEINH
jgi:hypothetical protein